MTSEPLIGNRSRHAVFLCYHSVNPHGPPLLSVAPEAFERQLATLRHWGFASGSRHSLVGVASGRPPRRPVAFLTFDDGFRDIFTEAFPRLRAYGFSALVFLLPPLVDTAAPLAWPQNESWRQGYPDVLRSLGWAEVEEMFEAGIEFGSHSCSHRVLTDLDDQSLAHELFESRARIKERLGRCDTLAYPFGAFDARVADAAVRAGYSFAFSLPYGWQTVGPQAGATRMSIPRIAIFGHDGDWLFRFKLAAGGRRLLLSRAKAVLR